MWGWVDGLSGLLLDATLAGAALLGLAALLMVGCRQPARRCSLARGAFLGALAIVPLVGFWPARPRIHLGGPVLALAAPFRPSWPAASARVEADSLAQSNLVPPSGWRSSVARQAPRILTLGYLAGLACGLAWLLLGWGFSAWLIQGSVAPRVATSELYQALRPPGRWFWPRLRVAARVRRPVLLGLLRPTILIPLDLDRTPAQEQLRLSLLHELAHADRGDAWFCLVGSLAQATWFFLPWAWWMRKQMRLDQEFLADHRASLGFGPFGSYAASLVDLAAPRTSRPAQVSDRPLGLWGSTSALFQRVLMLVRCPYPVEIRAPRWWRWSLPPIVALFTLMASGLTLRSEETREAPPARGAGTQSFVLRRLVLAEEPAGPDGTTPIKEVLIRLPERYSLLFDVWAEPGDLAQIRVAGFGLGTPEAEARGPQLPSWHQAEIVRDGQAVKIRVDGLAVAPGEPTAAPSAWLSVQPAPNRVGLFRNIRLSW